MHKAFTKLLIRLARCLPSGRSENLSNVKTKNKKWELNVCLARASNSWASRFVAHLATGW